MKDANGVVVTVTDEQILDAMRLSGRHGVYAEPGRRRRAGGA
ncbi:MAG: hypothetical protein R3C45_13155 [Phycisphaerales bacterium]